MSEETETVAPFAWMAGVKEPIPESELPTGRTMADLTEAEQAIIRAYAKEGLERACRPMTDYASECERMAGNKQSILGALAVHSLRKRLDEKGLDAFLNPDFGEGAVRFQLSR